MKIAVVNFVSSQSVAKNVERMEAYVSFAAEKEVDLIVFPELCITGYAFYIENHEAYSPSQITPVIDYFREIADSHNISICYGTPYYTENGIYNSAVFISPNQLTSVYHKIHLYGKEHRIFKCGTEPTTVETRFGKIGIGICYDTISFPELFRYYARIGVNLYLNLSALEKESTSQSKKYMRRVLEYHVQSNGIYIASSNATGKQDTKQYLGGSCVVGPNRLTEDAVCYYTNKSLSIQEGIFITDIELNENLRFIYEPNRFNSKADYRTDLYEDWLNRKGDI